MKKILTLLCAIMSVGLITAQQFPKKHLLEHFTGEACGYCPGGYSSIYDFTEKNSNVIWVSHHKGYANDEYTITASSSAVTVNGVQGAPSCAINRSAMKYVQENGTIGGSTAAVPSFHPAYLATLKTELEDSTFASVEIQHEYNPETRELKVIVNGEVTDATWSAVKLSVCLTESGMMGKQADYNNTFNGWAQYRHVHVPRVFLTAALGDKLELVEGKYTDTLTTTLKDTWQVDSMSVVAYITGTTNKPVINAATTPILAETKGADHFKPEGIEAVPVSELYPEEDKSLEQYLGSNVIELDTYNGAPEYTSYPQYGFNYWSFYAYNQKKTCKIGTKTCFPFMTFQFFTSTSVTKFPTSGVYPLNNSEKAGTAYAGTRDDEYHQIYGSEIYLVNVSGQNLNLQKEWLLTDGEIEFFPDGFVVRTHSYRGDEMTFYMGDHKPTGIENTSAAEVAPCKTIQDGVLQLHVGDKTYDVMGRMIK